jgi:penicillin-binding protein 1A
MPRQNPFLRASPEDRPRPAVPPAAKRPKRAARPARPARSTRWLRRSLDWGLAAAIWVAMGVVAVVAYYATDLPDLNSLTATLRKPSVTVLAADGQTLAAFGDVYGDVVTLDTLPAALPQAVMATEDRHFYHHFGLDLIGLARAALVDLRARHIVQGGSTITQQLAKNLFLTPERSLKRKIQEVLVALWLERKFSKDQILTLYLNRVYLGSGIWGVDAAARHYFDVPATQLDLYQCAVLAGLLKAPSRYNPQSDRPASIKRTAQVLDNMVAAGYIDVATADRTKAAGLTAAVKPASRAGRYFADWIHDQAAQYLAGDRDIVVETTLDPALQKTAETALDVLLAGPGAKAGVTQGAIVVLSPDGAVRAMVGGRDYGASQFNRAVQGLRQPGSSFKAFLYLAALEAGWRESDTIEDVPITTGKYRPQDYGHKYEGVISLRQAFAKSSNVAAVRLIERIGPKRVVAVAKRLGITSPLHADASLALGTSEASLLEMTAAYAAFADNGLGVFPYGFDQVTDGRQTVLYHREGGGAGRVVDAAALVQMTDMMKAVIAEGTGKAAAIDRPAAGKTGTTQDYKDAWFIGFTADYVGGVWLGNDDNAPLNKITGGSLPAQLWHTVMLAAHQGLPPRPLAGDAPPPEQAAGEQTEQAAPAKDEDESVWQGLLRVLGR